jgi:hypothetical protein
MTYSYFRPITLITHYAFILCKIHMNVKNRGAATSRLYLVYRKAPQLQCISLISHDASSLRTYTLIVLYPTLVFSRQPLNLPCSRALPQGKVSNMLKVLTRVSERMNTADTLSQ